ncbi:hypothetical protein RIL183_03211 [Roseburia inulinivorans]|uniref:PRD domain-containing protein n=1 Tax=Roseburia inulinivorans TaxID=360807 RepID=A0A0M6WMM3_9FIRM|nr:PRD domain-containing protein [Roseburia inulinivorans]CRL37184.1 hypothetical protein RIL183_03211 [Roseburia inulinivorans]
MVIQKVINNNVISAYDENQQEVVIMGKGIGFKAHTGDAIDESRVEKVFRIENEKLSRQFQEILENIPLEHMQLTSDIITYAKKNLNVQLNQSIYITLTDHINFAIQRQVQGIQLKNALLWEIKKFYHQEYLMGKYAINLLNEKLGTKFSEDEAGFIALHFVNAEYDTTINDTFAMTNMIQGILELVKQEMGIEFDEESLHYERFVTHLKFLAQRLYRHELLKDEEIEFAKLMENKYPGEYECSKHIAEYIEKEYGGQISGEEIMFLAPALYVVYAALYGIFTVITVLVGFRAGFCFSAGATDLLFSASLPAAKNTWMIIPLGIAAFIVFYVVFRFAITKFDLKTPGREDDDVEAEKKVDLGSSDYTTVAATILEGVGGAANVTSIDNCITRLRLEVKDSSLVDEKKIKSAGAAGVIRPSKTAVQVVVGTKVQFVADEFKKLCK